MAAEEKIHLPSLSLPELQLRVDQHLAMVLPTSTFEELAAINQQLLACEQDLIARNSQGDTAASPLLLTLQSQRQQLQMRLRDMIPGLHRYDVGRTLSKTLSGKLKLAQHILSRTLVAIKISDLEVAKQKADSPEREVRLLRQLSTAPHPNVVRLLDEFKGQDSHTGHDLQYMVMELCGGGDIFNFIQTNPRPSLPHVVALFRQLMQGIAHLHAQRIAHLDISIENCVFDTQGVLKIIDFGLARHFPPNTPTVHQGVVGKLNYMAPEVRVGIPFEAMAADIYSCGIVLLTVLCGELPYRDLNDNDARDLRRGRIHEMLARRGLQDRVPDAAADLITAMTALPQHRPTAQQVLQHPFLQ